MKAHSVVEVMRHARKARSWSQRDLATVSGVSANTIGGWESGAHQPPVDRLATVLAALDHQLLAVPATTRAWLLLVEIDDAGQPISARAIPNNGNGAP